MCTHTCTHDMHMIHNQLTDAFRVCLTETINFLHPRLAIGDNKTLYYVLLVITTTYYSFEVKVGCSKVWYFTMASGC